MSLRLITFDLDDTLWDVAPVMHGAEASLRDWLAVQAPRLGPVPVEHAAVSATALVAAAMAVTALRNFLFLSEFTLISIDSS